MSNNILSNVQPRYKLLSRELGLIKFFERILFLANDSNVPVLERLSFLCIVSRNCDELFEVRVARLLTIKKKDPDKILESSDSVDGLLYKIKDAMNRLYRDIYKTYYQLILTDLVHHGIKILKIQHLNHEQRKWTQKYFEDFIKPFLIPININQRAKFPKIENKSLHLAIYFLEHDKPFSQKQFAIIQAPRSTPRMINLPSTGNDFLFVLLQDVIKFYIHELFENVKIIDCFPFKVTRSANFSLKNKYQSSRLSIMQEIHNRSFADCSRLELDSSEGIPPQDLTYRLMKQFSITAQELYLVHGPVNLSRLNEIYEVINRRELKFPKYTPGVPRELSVETDIFDAIKKNDILIHSPFQSFNPVLELTRQAAFDPKIKEIKITVYRTGYDSEVVQNLIYAAQNGKRVVASVELFARFDEETNIEVTRKLESSGVNVVYGVLGYKVHAKMLLVSRQEGSELVHYAHIGTGNYHQKTARIYTDFGLLTADHDVTEDVNNIFSQIMGEGRIKVLKSIFQAPFNLYSLIIDKINQEAIHAKEGKHGQIIAKMNTLTEPRIIESLYNASQAGVKIQLIVRGACGLYPKLPNISENIEVRSVVGRFLEHTRVFYFFNNGIEDVYLSSADWMKRNFFKRIETCLTIKSPVIKARIFKEGLQIYLQDNCNSWVMQADGNYIKLGQDENMKELPRISAHARLMQMLGEDLKSLRKSPRAIFHPHDKIKIMADEN